MAVKALGGLHLVGLMPKLRVVRVSSASPAIRVSQGGCGRGVTAPREGRWRQRGGRARRISPRTPRAPAERTTTGIDRALPERCDAAVVGRAGEKIQVRRRGAEQQRDGALRPEFSRPTPWAVSGLQARRAGLRGGLAGIGAHQPPGPAPRPRRQPLRHEVVACWPSASGWGRRRAAPIACARPPGGGGQLVDQASIAALERIMMSRVQKAPPRSARGRCRSGGERKADACLLEAGLQGQVTASRRAWRRHPARAAPVLTRRMNLATSSTLPAASRGARPWRAAVPPTATAEGDGGRVRAPRGGGGRAQNGRVEGELSRLLAHRGKPPHSDAADAARVRGRGIIDAMPPPLSRLRPVHTCERSARLRRWWGSARSPWRGGSASPKGPPFFALIPWGG